MTVIDGKAVSAKVKAEVAEEIKKLCREPERAPGLAVVLVGEDPASQVYVRNKKRACESCGINSFEYLLSADESEENLLALIDSLNRDETFAIPAAEKSAAEEVTEKAIGEAE